MTDPGAAERLAALRSTRSAPKVPHARAAKILTAGLSTSMVLGIVSYLAHSANIHAAAQARLEARQATSQIIADKIAKVAKPDLTVPATSVPVAVGALPVAVPAPHVVVVPVPQPALPTTKQPTTQQPSTKPATTSRSSK
jgi:hypothetical protein